MVFVASEFSELFCLVEIVLVHFQHPDQEYLLRRDGKSKLNGIKYGMVNQRLISYIKTTYFPTNLTFSLGIRAVPVYWVNHFDPF